MTQISTAEFRKALGDKATIWGGIPATMFEPTCSDEEFDNIIIKLIKEVAPGYNFIMGMGDNVPFDGDIERVGRVVELIDKYGSLPISI
jgi:uroporphyrinogen-III decarboxylase